jgi:SPP1 gp7 family putative phage head morphogenesis protein
MIDWNLPNTDAAQWIESYEFDLSYADIETLDKDQKTILRQALIQFVQEGGTVGDVVEKLTPLSAEHAGTIANTEITRAYAQGNLASWRESGVTESKRWNTNRDELVCSICRPLDEKVVPLDEKFGGIYDGPPAHPDCRCWISPVVSVPNVSQLNETQPTKKRSFFDRLLGR